MSSRSKVAFGVALLAVILVAGFWALSSQDADALPPFSRMTDYFSDPGFTDYVGACYRSCSGDLDCEPDTQETAYRVVELDYHCIGSNYCCIRCVSEGLPVSCPANILSGYPCEECS